MPKHPDGSKTQNGEMYLDESIYIICETIQVKPCTRIWENPLMVSNLGFDFDKNLCYFICVMLLNIVPSLGSTQYLSKYGLDFQCTFSKIKFIAKGYLFALLFLVIFISIKFKSFTYRDLYVGKELE